MLYFSTFLNKTVKTEDGIVLGKLDDFIFLISTFQPLISKIVVLNNNKKPLFIPSEDILNLEPFSIIVKKNYQLSQLVTNELFILRNILDKQIIDLKGNKIVRVNDVCLEKGNNNYYLIAVDIGLLGILRRLGIEDLVINFLNLFKIKIKPNFLSWVDIQPLELSRGVVLTKQKEEKLARLLPEDLADYLEKTNIENARKIINLLDDRKAVEVINQLNLTYQSALFKKFKLEEAIKFINFLDPDEAVDILLTLNKKTREKILKNLNPKKKEEISKLLRFSETSIGELMTSEFIKVFPETTAKEAIRIIKKEGKDFSFLTTTYVVNNQNQLIGVFNLQELILQDLQTPVYRFMHQNLIVIHLSTPKEIALKKMLKYNLQVLPVINDNRQILGVVTIDDLSNFIFEKLNYE